MQELDLVSGTVDQPTGSGPVLLVLVVVVLVLPLPAQARVHDEVQREEVVVDVRQWDD